MREPLGELGFSLETPQALGIGPEGRRYDLDRDGTA
jgi:hypothetical protein